MAEVSKIRGHAKQCMVDEGKVPADEKQSNDEADMAATFVRDELNSWRYRLQELMDIQILQVYVWTTKVVQLPSVRVQ